MLKWCCLLIALTATAASAVPVWRWVDENGVVHYSDRPIEGAERIELGSAPTISTQESASTTPREAGPAEPAPAQPYRRFDVTAPQQQETLWNIGGTLEVQVELEPPLQPGHRLDVYLDGERRNLNAESTQLTVPEVYRGVHTLQAVVLDESGDDVLRSLAVTFMVQQTSILNPNNPNAN